MARAEFPKGLDGSENLPRTRRELRNVFWASGRVLARPGITQLNTTGGVARGAFVWNDALYQVASQSLIKITNTDTGANSTIGTIAGPDPVRVAIGFNEAVIVVPGGAIYTLNASDTLTDISGNSNFVPCNDVCHIDGRFVYIPSSGDPAFFSDVGAAGTVQAASFFDAEELPDKNAACWNLNNTLFIAGTDSLELFRNTGSTVSAFTRISGSRILNGYISGSLEYAGTRLFIGRETGQDFGIYAVAQGRADKISNERIDTILATYTQTELEEAIAGRLKWRGYDIATFALRRHAFGFLDGNWFTLDTVFNGISRPWGAGYIQHFQGDYYTAYQGRIGKFAQVNTDYGERITRVIDTAFEEGNNDHFACQSIELGVAQGYNTAAGSVALMLSRDNVTYGQPLYRDLGALGEYGRDLKWEYPGGLGTYEGFMGVRLYTTEDVDFSADHLIVNLRG